MPASRLALVTGCSSGIGLALTRRLLESSWPVVGLARRPAGIDHAGFRQLRCDLSDPAALRAIAERELAPLLAEPDRERLLLVNNAADVGALARLAESGPEALTRLFALNSAAPIYLMGLAVARVPAGVKLRIVNISSGAAHGAFPGLGDYCATKAALRLAGRVQAVELAEDGRAPAEAAVFSFEPGVVATAMQVAARDADPARFPGQASFREFHERGLLAEPSAVVGQIVDFAEGDPAEHFTERRYGA